MRQIGRRAMFFAAMVAISLLLYYPTPPNLRWLCVFCASLAGFWAVAFGLEDLTTPTERPGRRRLSVPPFEREPDNPFAPPPPPGASP